MIHSTDWTSSLFLLACVVGIFAGLNGIKAGWAGLIAALAGLLIKGALSVTWVYWWCGCVLVGVMLAGVASVLLKNNAIRELITGIQRTKDAAPLSPTEINSELSGTQSKATKKMVLNTKAQLKYKGVI